MSNALAEEESVDPEPGRDSHVEFHRTLIRLTRNDALVLVTNMLYDILQSHPLHTHGGVFDRTGNTEMMAKNATVVHRQVLDLIHARASREAEAVWEEHLADAIVKTSQVFSDAVVDVFGNAGSEEGRHW